MQLVDCSMHCESWIWRASSR